MVVCSRLTDKGLQTFPHYCQFSQFRFIKQHFQSKLASSGYVCLKTLFCKNRLGNFSIGRLNQASVFTFALQNATFYFDLRIVIIKTTQLTGQNTKIVPMPYIIHATRVTFKLNGFRFDECCSLSHFFPPFLKEETQIRIQRPFSS